MAKLFDPVALMDQNVAANATRRDPLPIGETTAQIVEMKWSQGVSQKTNPPTPWHRLDCTLEISDPEYVSQCPIVRDGKVKTFLGIMVEMRDGEIASGPNVNIKLGRLREATGTNGKPLGMMNGQWLRIQIGQKPHPTDPDAGNIDEIVSYTKV